MEPAHLLELGAATLGESGGHAMAPRIRPAWPGATVAGRAFTAACAPGDNLAVHVAVAHAPAGSVLVVDAADQPERGYWGEVLTVGAQARGLLGLVIDGCVRDVDAVAQHGWGMFATGIALPGASKDQPCRVGGPVRVGGVPVATGDWVVGDVDGVVVIREDQLGAVVSAGQARAAVEQELFARLRAGATTVDLMDLDVAKAQLDL